jgi:ubiquinone/menaquinone biosynthesis C-methylase UbiE
MSARRGLQLDRVVLLGRTFAEYRGYFLLEPEKLKGKRVLDVAGGVSSFCAEANAQCIHVTSVDPIYSLSPEEIARRSGPDLDHVIAAVRDLPTYRWTTYRGPEHVRELRQKAVSLFLEDYPRHRERYQAGLLPELPFADNSFVLTLVSYFLFVYQDQFDYEFHRDAIRELMRITSGEVRIYPIVTFEAEPSAYLPRLREDAMLREFSFEVVRTDFEFLINSNSFLRISRKP